MRAWKERRRGRRHRTWMRKCDEIEGTWGGKRRGISLEGGRTRI